MKKYYLIDYENVDLSGFNVLSSYDSIYIFHTSNNATVRFDFLSFCTDKKIKCEFIKAKKGSQSVDKLILFYSGNLINEKDAFIVIVSHDKGYDDIISKYKGRIIRREQIDDANICHTQIRTETVQKAKTESKKTVLNNMIIRMLTKNKYERKTAETVASIVVKHMNRKDRKQQIYKELVKEYGQDKGKKLYDHVKAVI